MFSRSFSLYVYIFSGVETVSTVCDGVVWSEPKAHGVSVAKSDLTPDTTVEGVEYGTLAEYSGIFTIGLLTTSYNCSFFEHSKLNDSIFGIEKFEL